MAGEVKQAPESGGGRFRISKGELLCYIVRCLRPALGKRNEGRGKLVKAVCMIAMVPVAAPVFVAPGVSQGQSAERGREVFKAIAKRYPKVQPIVWGLATARPQVALFVPETEWAKLARGGQISLTLYVEGLIPTVRANPDRYIGDPSDAALRAKVARLCADCWVVGTGRLTLDGEGVLFEKVVVQGDSGWEKSHPRYRGVKASEFRQGLSSRTSAEKAAGTAEKMLSDSVVVSVPTASIRSGPGIGYGVLGWAKQGESFAVEGDEGSWYQVQYQGREAWIHKSVVSKASSQSMSPRKW